MMLDKVTGMPLDVLIRDLTKIDSSVGVVSTNIKLFMDNGNISRVAVQISWKSEDRFFILDDNLNLIYQESYGALANMHPDLDSVVTRFIGDSLKDERANKSDKRRLRYAISRDNKGVVSFSETITRLKRLNVV